MFKLKDLIQFMMPVLSFDSGGSSPSTPTSSTTNTSNIPEYARPYVETMLGTAQQQLYNYEKDANGNMVPTTLKGYTPYSTDMNNYFAGFQPLQQQAFGEAKNLGPSQQNTDATNLAGMAGINALGTNYDGMQATSQNFGNNSAAQYMSPFAMQALMPTLNEQARQSQIQQQQNQAQAVGRGAFGGSRDALVQAENQRNLGIQQGNTISQGMNTAYNNAMNQFNADQARNMQAQQANIGQQQFGANLGMQGINAANQAAQTLGTLGQNQYNQEAGAIGLQNQLGTQQQQLEQNKINQAIQNYATGQQWGMQQLGNMSSLLRGLPMQSTTTQSYQAAPSALSQIAGLGAIGAGVAAKAAKGGFTKDIKKRTSAGLAAGALNKVMKG